MRGALRLLYGAAGHLARGAAAIAPPGDGKLLRALRARRDIRERYATWAATGRDRSRPLLWMHAPSVGEGLQARPILQLFRGERPNVQLAYSFFSPSAEAFARGLDVDYRDYLPFDTTEDARLILDALQPQALVFSKLDVWPLLAEEATNRGVRIGLVSATLAASSSRRSAIASSLLRDAYARLDAVGAIDAADADRLIEIGVRPAAISVTGDTRYDQVWARALGVDRRGALLAPLASTRPTLVAGSTWPSDEAPLLAAWTTLRAQVPNARLLIAPHEPTPAHLDPIEAWARRASLSLARLGAAGIGAADVVLVDQTGVLGDLYALADVAFVGGGFHGAGLHSVLEPAAFGAPVVFGPRHANSRDASILLERGGGAEVADERDLVETLSRWLTAAEGRHNAGQRARDVVKDGLGAARRSFELVDRLLR